MGSSQQELQAIGQAGTTIGAIASVVGGIAGALGLVAILSA